MIPALQRAAAAPRSKANPLASTICVSRAKAAETTEAESIPTSSAGPWMSMARPTRATPRLASWCSVTIRRSTLFGASVTTTHARTPMPSSAAPAGSNVFVAKRSASSTRLPMSKAEPGMKNANTRASNAASQPYSPLWSARSSTACCHARTPILTIATRTAATVPVSMPLRVALTVAPSESSPATTTPAPRATNQP